MKSPWIIDQNCTGFSRFQFPGAGYLWVFCRVALILFLLSFPFAHQFLGARRCTFRSVLLLLLRLPRTFEFNLRWGSLRRESLRVKFVPLFEKSPFRCNLLTQKCMQLRHQTLSARIVLSSFPLTVILHISRLREVVARRFFHLDCPQRSRGVKKTVSLPSLLSLPPAMSPNWRIEVALNEHPRWNKNSCLLYGIATWPINSGAIKFPPVCPWMARIYNKEFWEFMQCWNLILLLPW